VTTRDTTWLIAAIAIIVIGITYAIAIQPSDAILPQLARVSEPGFSTGNPTNDRLLASSAGQQATALGQVVGHSCAGGRAFYMGIGKPGVAEDKAFWSVECASGASWSVEIAPDSKGTTTVLECSMLRFVAKVNCFEKFSAHLPSVGQS
jgi:hypothetical protein